MKHLAILATATAASALPAAAQESFVLPEISLTANLEDTELSRSGSSVSVLTKEDFSGHAGQPISRTISRLPGISRQQSGPLGTTGKLQLRGAPAQYLPVIIDGIDVSDAAAGQPYFNIGGMTGAGIGRAELLRGAQSALYGSRAVAGVLSLQSLRPTEEGVQQELTLEAGSYDTSLASYGVAMRRGGTDLAFSASHISTDGFSAADENDGNFEADGYEASRVSFYAAHELQNGAVFGFNGFWEDSAGEFDDFGGDVDQTPDDGIVDATPGNDGNEKETYGIRAFSEFSSGPFDFMIEATHYRIKRYSTQDFVAPTYQAYDLVTSKFVGTRSKFRFQAGTDLGASGARFIFGADTEKEKAEGNGDARLSGIFTEVSLPVGDRVDVNASLRHDDHSRFGGFTSGRLSAVYRADNDLLFRASLGNGFRAPSLYELFGPYGNAGLQREDSQGAEIGVEKRWGDDSYLRATAFWMEADNLIGWDDRGTLDWADDGYNQVKGKARRRGLELDGRYAFGAGHALTAAYTYTDNRVASEWAEVPAHSLSLGFETEFATGTTAAVDLRHVADRPNDMEDFTTVDLLLTHPLRNGSEAYLRVGNIFDEEYQLTESYGTSDRAVYAGFRASF